MRPKRCLGTLGALFLGFIIASALSSVSFAQTPTFLPSQTSNNTECPAPIWPMTKSCSGNAVNCSENRCLCKKGYSSLSDAVDYSHGSIDCPTHIVSRTVFICVGLIVCSLNFISTSVSYRRVSLCLFKNICLF
jgi:hypothetical protein